MLPRDRWSSSWIVTRRETGEVLGEFFSASLVEKFNPERVTIETAHQYLCRINRTAR
jgi:hypothetical protein